MLPKVDILVQKYSKPQAGNKSYLEYLNNDLATNIKKLSTLHSEYTDMYEKWVSRVYLSKFGLHESLSSVLLMDWHIENYDRNGRRRRRVSWLDSCFWLDPDGSSSR